MLGYRKLAKTFSIFKKEPIYAACQPKIKDEKSPTGMQELQGGILTPWATHSVEDEFLTA